MTGLLILAYIFLSFLVLIAIARKDVFFAVFTAMLVVYSAIAQAGYFLYPDISDFVLRMYFGPEALSRSIIFSLLSLLAVYIGFRVIYLPVVNSAQIHVSLGVKAPEVSMSIYMVHLLLLGAGYVYYAGALSYVNVADVDFVAAMGLPFRIFWQLFKLTPFVLLALYATVRQELVRKTPLRLVGLWVFLCLVFSFAFISVSTGNRADPLAVLLGLLGYEYFVRHEEEWRRSNHHKKSARTLSLRFYLAAGAVLAVGLTLLTALESFRGTLLADTSLDVPLVAQAVLLKDYYAPFHVLIGAMHHEYIQPIAVLLSNAANSLMFLNVDLLQAFVVNEWAPDSVTRAASPAMFFFVEGYVVGGWLGFVYNGLVFTVGLTAWRCLSRTSDSRFNAIAFGLAVAVAATVARSQSAYFLKNAYLFFAPVLLLYCFSTGRYPNFLKAVAGKLIR